MQNRLNRRFVPWIVAHSFEFWYYYTGAIVSLYLLHSLQSAIPELAKNLGDLVGEGQISDINIWDFFILAGGILLFRTLSRLLFFYPARIQQKNLRLEIMQRMEETSPKKYKNFNDGQLFQTIYNDFNRIRGFIGFALLQVGNVVIAAAVFIPKIMAYNGDFLIAFSPLVVCVVILAGVIYLFQPYMVKGMDLYGEVQNFLLESYDAKKTIKNFHSEFSFYNMFRKHSGAELKLFFISSVGRTISFPLLKLGFGASLLWGAYIVKQQGLPGTALIYFSGFLFLILEPLAALSWIGIVTSQGYAAWVRIKRLTDDLDQPDLVSWDKVENVLHPEMDFWEIEISFNIQKNAWNVFIGNTGCGKSYVIENLADLFYKKSISYSYIQQEPYLYNDTILNNIFLGQEVTAEKLKYVKDYIQMFGLDQLENSIDAVLSLEVGENGKKLSGGQSKRVALIRSLVADVDYILWDDPFSSVDLILEKEIIERMKRNTYLKSKTFIMSSHRLSTVKACDWIIFLDKVDGISEIGTKNNLLEQKSKTSEYFQKQLV